MVKFALIFLVIFSLFYFGISFLVKLTGKEKWKLTKSLLYSIMCSSIAMGTIALIIFLF